MLLVAQANAVPSYQVITAIVWVACRLGANGNLRHLPVSILRDIMTIALPQKPCKIFISTANDSWAEA